MVTGGAGFVGSHLVEMLLRRGDDVLVLDDFSSGDIRNLALVLDHPRLHLCSGSVVDRSMVRSALRGADRAFHLAAPGGGPADSGSVAARLRTDVHGTENVLEAALDSSTEVLLISPGWSAACSPTEPPATGGRQDERPAAAVRPSSCEDADVNEAYARVYWGGLGLPVHIVRLFDTIGPRQVPRDDATVPHLVAEALAGRPLTVAGDGEQICCFAYVGDVVPAMIAIQESKEGVGHAYDVAGTERISVNDLAERVIHVTRSRSSVVRVPSVHRRETVRRPVPDTVPVRRLVGYAPVTSLDEMIARIAESLGAPVVRRRPVVRRVWRSA
ncbi:MAG: NAD-dependent epimerase/dehydratase family protein [Actinomycetales bacterium]|nr:MAG: NAD-dependent epimerase/dehydratase family protein [Actinomycetales bacterium]